MLGVIVVGEGADTIDPQTWSLMTLAQQWVFDSAELMHYGPQHGPQHANLGCLSYISGPHVLVHLDLVNHTQVQHCGLNTS